MITKEELGKNLQEGGHVGYLAGGLMAGGGTIGCYGIKSEVKKALAPENEYLADLVKDTSRGNKIKPIKYIKRMVARYKAKKDMKEDMKKIVETMSRNIRESIDEGGKNARYSGSVAKHGQGQLQNDKSKERS